MNNTTPPMPATQQEWEAHWAFYRLTVLQRDEAWAENERLVEAIQTMGKLAPTVRRVVEKQGGEWVPLYEEEADLLMGETKMAKLLCEVQWGIIPGTVDGNRQWGFSREEVEAAFEDAPGPGTPDAWRQLLAPAYEEMDRRMAPFFHNWVTMTWLWL